MATTTENRRQTLDPTTPFFAMVGVTDLAVERVRGAVAEIDAKAAERRAEARKAVSEFDPKAAVQEVPTRAVAAVLEAAGKAEAQYEGLASRGKELVDRIVGQRSTQDLFNQYGSTVNLTKGALTFARKRADDTATAVREVLAVGRRGAAATVGTAVEGTEVTAEATREVAEATADTTQSAAQSAGTRARKNAAATRTAAKAVRASASKTASTAGKAAKDGAEKIGD